jgi:4-amino-4-deoxy-L-arabinose transferase-like glycosyltransferase
VRCGEWTETRIIRPTTPDPDREARWVLAAALALSFALIGARSVVHLCDGDVQLYRTVSRNIVESGKWFDLTYTPAVLPRFREHLPFGLWPGAVVIAMVGDAAVPRLGWLWSVPILIAVAWVARRLFSTWAAAGAVLVIGTMDAFALHCTFPRLDGPTALFGFFSAIPWLSTTRPAAGAEEHGAGPPSRAIPGHGGLAFSIVCASIACAIKGPFGLLPLCCICAGRAIADRSLEPLLAGAGAAAAAALPVLGFLLYQRGFGDRSWWDGYVGAQLLPSITGARVDGDPRVYYPFVVLLRQFWPGLALLPFAIRRALRSEDRTRRAVLVACAVGALIACLPHRKLPHHLGVLYPLAALVTGEALGAGLAWLAARPGSKLAVARVIGASAVLAWVLLVAGRPFWLRENFCLPHSDLRAEIAALPPGSDVALISTGGEWRNIAALAAERRVVAWPVAGWRQAAALPVQPSVAIVEAAVVGQPDASWRKGRAIVGWTWWTRESR